MSKYSEYYWKTILEPGSPDHGFMDRHGVGRIHLRMFDVTAEDFSDEVCELVKKGVRVVGGCCGTTPAYIKALTDKTRGMTPVPVRDKNLTVVSSYTHAVKLGKALRRQLPLQQFLGTVISKTQRKDQLHRDLAGVASCHRFFLRRVMDGVYQKEK